MNLEFTLRCIPYPVTMIGDGYRVVYRQYCRQICVSFNSGALKGKKLIAELPIDNPIRNLGPLTIHIEIEFSDLPVESATVSIGDK